MAFAIRYRRWRLPASRRKRCGLGLLASTLFSFRHFLEERLCLLFICKGETSKAVFELEGVKERPVLVVCEPVVDFLVP